MPKRLSLLLTALLLPMLLVATLIFASRTQAGSGDICAVGCTYSTIQQAVSTHPTENVTLAIGSGTFAENVEITRSISLAGAGEGLTIIDGQMTGTVVLVDNSAVLSIAGVTIRNGDTASVDGGGLLVKNSTVTLTNSTVENNRAPNGAGIANSGTLVLEDVTVQNNTADLLVGNISNCSPICTGGGIYNSGQMTVRNSTIFGNTAQEGGGINNAVNSMLTLTNVTVDQNTAAGATITDEPSAGGGIANAGTISVSGSTIRNNEAVVGGGVSNEGVFTLTSSAVHNNEASSRGGGLHNSFNLTVQTSNIYSNLAGTGGGGGISSASGTVNVLQTAVYNNNASGSGGGIAHNVPIGANSFTLTNSTVSGNTAGVGGGLWNNGIAATSLQNSTFRNNQSIVASTQTIARAGGSVTVKNSIITISQAGGNCNSGLTSTGYNITSDSSCGLGTATDLPNTNPQLGPLQNNGGSTLTHALLLGSPAINSGSGCPAVDQRGVARPFGPACDRGAYEFNKTVLKVYLPSVLRP